MVTLLERRNIVDPLIILAVVLLIIWVLGGFVFHFGGALIHVLFVIIAVIIIYRLVTRKKVL
jgi:hypothetical protein